MGGVRSDQFVFTDQEEAGTRGAVRAVVLGASSARSNRELIMKIIRGRFPQMRVFWTQSFDVNTAFSDFQFDARSVSQEERSEPRMMDAG